MPGGSVPVEPSPSLLRTSRMTTMLKLRSSALEQFIILPKRISLNIKHQTSLLVQSKEDQRCLKFHISTKSYLTQSWQLYAEAAMPALERLYTIAPSFRAEESRTRRHLTEFWHAEMEMAWASNDEIMAHGEGVVRHIARTLLTNEKMN